MSVMIILGIQRKQVLFVVYLSIYIYGSYPAVLKSLSMALFSETTPNGV